MRPLSPLRLLLPLLLLLLAACTTTSKRPDLARLYEAQANDPAQPPVVLIHGLMGSTLVDRDTGKQFWPGSLGALAFGSYADLGGDNLVPGDLVYGLGGVVDFYGELTTTLEKVGHYRRAQPGQPVTANDRRRYYVFLYDWRRDNVTAARGLDALIDRIRADYHDPALRVDLIAHSNGGLVANYFLRYGGTDVLDDAVPVPTGEGALHVRRVLMLGTPHLGSATSTFRLYHGMRIGLRTVPVEMLATFATPFETLPAAQAGSVVDATGKVVPIDLFDPETWRSRQWSVYSPEVIARVRAGAPEPSLGNRAVADVQAAFERHLVRAGRFQRALATPLAMPDVEVALFGGDCTLTLARSILVRDDAGERLAFTPREVLPPRSPEELTRDTTMRLEHLLFEPGDGLITRVSQSGRARPLPDGTRPAPIFPQAQSFFLCESHGQLTANPYFQNNLLNFLLGR
jgi:pimeloyl-ACP methyl ester carboxylesterase